MKSLSSATAFLLLLLATSAAFSALGVLLPAAQAFSRVLIPVSGVVLMLTSIAWVLPEVAETFGWPIAALAMAAATALLWLVDRYVYPVCPSCSHSHDHHSCSTRLHGFAVPMLIAVALHNLFDGWTVAFGESGVFHGGHSLSAGVIAHKIPECLAFGVILRAAMRSKTIALASAMGVQAATLVGALLQQTTSHWVSPSGVAMLLVFGGATFLYLGFHSLHGEWKRRTASATT